MDDGCSTFKYHQDSSTEVLTTDAVSPIIIKGMVTKADREIIEKYQKEVRELRRQRDRIDAMLHHTEALLALASGEVAGLTEKSDGTLNKAAFIRDLIKRAGSSGATYHEIATAMKEAGIQASVNYRYTIVNKWKADGLVGQHENGRIYWK